MTRRGRRDIERAVDDLEDAADRADDGDDDGGDGLTEKQLRHIRQMCANAPDMPPDVRERVAAADSSALDDVRELSEQSLLIIDWIAGREGNLGHERPGTTLTGGS